MNKKHSWRRCVTCTRQENRIILFMENIVKKNIRLLLPVTVLILASLACQTVPLPFGKKSTPVPGDSGQSTEPTQIPALVSSASLDDQQNVMTSLYAHVTPGIVSIQVLV